MIRSLVMCAALLVAREVLAEPYYLIVAGLGGQPDYEKQFVADAKALAEVARRTVGDESRVACLTGSEVSRESLEAAFARMAKMTRPNDMAIVMLIGHGTFDGEHYKFNIPGPDVDGDELLAWLNAIPARSQLVVDATSASGAILKSWATDGRRTVITATRTGGERNATRFGREWAAALTSSAADINKDGAITTREAFDLASRKVADSYKEEGTLATEHAQISGEAADHLTVARLGTRSERTPELDRMYAEAGNLEGEIEALRQKRATMDDAAYFSKLQPLLVQLAKLQQRIDRAEGKVAPDAGIDQGADPDLEGGKSDPAAAPEDAGEPVGP